MAGKFRWHTWIQRRKYLQDSPAFISHAKSSLASVLARHATAIKVALYNLLLIILFLHSLISEQAMRLVSNNFHWPVNCGAYIHVSYSWLSFSCVVTLQVISVRVNISWSISICWCTVRILTESSCLINRLIRVGKIISQ